MANKVILTGNLGRDTEVRFLPDGTKTATLNIATSESWKDRTSGERKERTEWHTVVIYGGLADVAEKYLKKGSKVYIEGQLHTRKWNRKIEVDVPAGKKTVKQTVEVPAYTTEVIVSKKGTLELLDRKPNEGGHDYTPDEDDEIPM